MVICPPLELKALMAGELVATVVTMVCDADIWVKFTASIKIVLSPPLVSVPTNAIAWLADELAVKLAV